MCLILSTSQMCQATVSSALSVPLRHDPGHAQVDFGEALAEIAGVERKIHFFAMDLPHSDACFVRAYPAKTAEAFCDGHTAAFAFFGFLAQVADPASLPARDRPNFLAKYRVTTGAVAVSRR